MKKTIVCILTACMILSPWAAFARAAGDLQKFFESKGLDIEIVPSALPPQAPQEAENVSADEAVPEEP